MKKTVKFLFAAIFTLMVIFALSLCVSAETEGYYTYSVSNGEATITDCSSSISGNVTIPSSLGGYPVTSIGKYAFSSCTGLTSVSIGNGVTSIGERTFSNCTGLTSVNIGNSVTSIGDRVFYDCDSLTSVNIGNGVTSIGDEAFYSCDSLTSIEIPDSVTSIGDVAFYNCTGLTSVSIGNGVTSIGNSAFYYCTGLTSVSIGNGVTSIGNSVFSSCTGLTSVNIPDSVTSIGSDAFNNTAYYNDDTNWVQDVLYIGKYLIDANNNISKCNIKEGTLLIAGSAFSSCTGLTSVNIPDSVTSIGDYAFYSCTGLTSVSIGNGVTSIGDYAFLNCTGLTSVNIGNSVTSIGERAFYWCSSLMSIEIPDSVTSIGSSAFYNCSGLTSIEIPDSVTSIGDYAFSSCNGLTSVSIGNGVTSIGSSAFSRCTSLEKITLPFVGSSRTASGSYDAVFGYIFGYTTSSASGTVRQYYSKYSSRYYYIPSSLKEVIITDATQIPYGAFYNCSMLTSITFPDSVTSIRENTFYNCSKLTSIKIPDSVTSIGNSAFSDCDSLTSIEIPDSVTSIGSSAFYNCKSLKTIEIPDSVTSIGRGAFSECISLEIVYYFGTEEQWENITIGDNNECLISASREYIVSVEDVNLNVTETEIYVGEALVLKASVLPENAYNKKIFWISSDESVATVENGVVTPVGVGTAVITVSSDDGGFTDSCTVKVLPVKATGIAIDKTTASVVVGREIKLNATVLPNNATNKNVTWYSGNTKIAKVKDGIVTGVAEGNATIIAMTSDGGFTAMCTVTVLPVKVEGVELNTAEVEMFIGENTTLTAHVLPEDAINKNITWKTSDESVASVENGVVTAIGEGVAKITVTTEDGGFTDICMVTVSPVKATGIVFENETLNVWVGGKITLNAKVLPENATNKNITYISADVNVATVENGLVKGVAEGSTVIIAIAEDGGFSAVCNVTVVSGKNGDADGDGKLTVFDAVKILRIIAGVSNSDAETVALADVDGDGILTITDATRILKYVSRISNTI